MNLHQKCVLIKGTKFNEYFESKIDYEKLKGISNNNEITKLLNKDILLANINGTQHL